MFSIPNFLTLAQCFLMHRVSVWNKYSWFIINCLLRELPEILVYKFYVVTALFFFVFKGIICCLHLDKHISITKVYSHSRRRKLICRMFFLIVLMADRVIDMEQYLWNKEISSAPCDVAVKCIVFWHRRNVFVSQMLLVLLALK